MMITLVATLCQLAAGAAAPSCTSDVFITNTAMSGLSMTECAILGQRIINDFLAASPLYHGAAVRSWRCLPGNHPEQPT